MKKNRWITRLAVLMLASYTLLAIGAAAAGTPGTESDPLVTLSYLNDTFMAELLKNVDEKLETRDKELAEKLDARVRQASQEGPVAGGEGVSTEVFTVVTLGSGQVLSGEIGCEVMLRVGAANCVASSAPGLIDETDGSTLSGGAALAKNHLYMMTVDERGVQAAAETVKLLVRGNYSIR